MIDRKKIIPLCLLVVGLLLILAACGSDAANNHTAENMADADQEIDGLASGPELIPLEMPFKRAWESSGHADFEAEAFRHWDEEDPAVIPISCAKCHSQYGYLDFLGVDGSELWQVDNDAPLGSTVTCVTCHNEVSVEMTSVTMPSGVEITGLGDESRCMQCHQGRASKMSVDESITALELSEDQVSEELNFVNIHYYAAAATKYGTVAQGGYEYEGKTYDAFFAHVEGYETCIDCHDPHTLDLKVNECSSCHEYTDVEAYKNVRMPGSLADYDGDGDLDEGIYFEIEGLQSLLFEAIQTYASDVAGAAIAYDSHVYPYFFYDTDGNGIISTDEANYANRYTSWTPRLLKAAYNFQVSLKDPGGYAHGGKYLIQLLYDSTEDLNVGVDLSNAHRLDHGHFAGSEEPFRHWDEEGVVPASCSKCHSAAGLPLFLEEGGVTISQPAANGFLCSTCHDDLKDFSRYEVESVTFPSGATISSEEPNSNLCMNCHQGRSSTAAVNQAIAGLNNDQISSNLRFQNVHYLPAGATRYGGEAHGAYEYAGNTYVGYFDHVGRADDCTDCHDKHALEIKVDVCSTCHNVETQADLYAIRSERNRTDWDGDGNNREGMKMEIDGLTLYLYQTMQAYANNQGTPIVYDAHAYPYYFNDTNANGVPDPDETIRENAFSSWTPALLKAAYNYQYAQKDPGAFAHNGQYVLQFLYDAIKDLGGNLIGLTRP